MKHLQIQLDHDTITSVGMHKFIEIMDANIWKKALAMNYLDNTARQMG